MRKPILLISYFLEDSEGSGIIVINNYQQIKSQSSCGLLGYVGLFSMCGMLSCEPLKYIGLFPVSSWDV